MNIDSNEISNLVIHQLRSFWVDVKPNIIKENVQDALQYIDSDFKDINSPRFQVKGSSVFNPLMSVHWMIFLYRLSSIIYKNGDRQYADQVYYLNKIMHAVDWNYAIDLPIHFLCEHPLGSVLGKASYGDYFLIYQGTSVGGSVKDDKLYYPVIIPVR